MKKSQERKKKKKEISLEEQKKIFKQQRKELEFYSKLIKDKIEKEKLVYKRKLEIEKKEDKALEKELMKHQNCREKITITIGYKKEGNKIIIPYWKSEKINIIKFKIK